MSDPYARLEASMKNKRYRFWANRTPGPIKAIHPMTKKVIEVDPQKDARIGEDWTKELARLPAVLYWYYQLRDTAETALREASHQEHNAEEDLYEELRARTEKLGVKKPTEQALKMMVRKHVSMRAAFRVRMDAEDMHTKLASACKAIEEKRWSLQNMINKYRAERGIKDAM